MMAILLWMLSRYAYCKQPINAIVVGALYKGPD